METLVWLSESAKRPSLIVYIDTKHIIINATNVEHLFLNYLSAHVAAFIPVKQM